MDDFDQTMMMICGQAFEALKTVAKKADYHDLKDAELVEKLTKIIYYSKLIPGGGEQSYARGVYGDGVSYRRGRDSMGRFTSYRGGPTGAVYEPGYASGSHGRTDGLRQKLEYLMSRVSGSERQAIQDALAELDEM